MKTEHLKEDGAPDFNRRNSETLENFNDFLYWREPLEIIDFDEIISPPEKVIDIPENRRCDIVSDNADNVSSTLKNKRTKESASRAMEKTNKNEKLSVAKKPKVKKKRNAQPTNATKPIVNNDDNSIISTGMYRY